MNLLTRNIMDVKGVTVTLDERYMTSITATKPTAAKKCVHTFKCLFNKDCESLAKNELSMMSNTELELLGRSYNLELDKRKKKSSLVNQLYSAM